ncbi:MAG: DUF2961 domain-containing protein [Deltaproteobacteria bacterium]|nr:DUF2961 domain-containing protein [Deltaproteobacteria bacterium]
MRVQSNGDHTGIGRETVSPNALAAATTADLLRLDGPGTIRKLRFTFAEPSLTQLQSLTLELTWDEFGVVDGELRVAGTGTEDYFNAGWYFSAGVFDSPFAGLNFKESDATAGSGRISAYRWHILTDEINFSNSFDLRMEYGANRPELADRYASVAYHYLTNRSQAFRE